MVEEGKYDRYRTVGMRQNLDVGMSTRERLESRIKLFFLNLYFSNTVKITIGVIFRFFIFYYEKKDMFVKNFPFAQRFDH